MYKNFQNTVQYLLRIKSLTHKLMLLDQIARVSISPFFLIKTLSSLLMRGQKVERNILTNFSLTWKNELKEQWGWKIKQQWASWQWIKPKDRRSECPICMFHKQHEVILTLVKIILKTQGYHTFALCFYYLIVRKK